MNLKVAILPLAIEPLEPEKNLRAVEGMIEKLPPGTDIAVLPELFSTGYVNNPEAMRQVAETGNGITMSALTRLAAKHGCAIAGSFIAKNDVKGNEIFNRAFFIEPGGDVTFYDKHHLFTPSREASIITAGDKICPTIRFRGWNIRLIVCYDLRFPAWCRNTGGRYDVLICPANWGGARHYAFKHLVIGRAIENQAYVVGANRTGADEFGEYHPGMSLIVSHTGKEIHQTDNSGIVTAELDYERMTKFREHFPALPDADTFTFIDDVKNGREIRD